VGHKRLIYTIDIADTQREETRKKTIDFFKINLGFTEDEITFIDRNEFG
jgi:hypothetical protein